ncbi:hypothetical protein [Paenibacillus sp. GCM10012303]|jgi:hypothetical protein|uniref:hypothetical protein n=1 Tax=Paenibacillus sp. GCM10012303 TaxID=3317340 RepID=UPI0036119B71
MKLFMTYSYGTDPDDDYWFELAVSVPAGHRAPAEVGEVSGISTIRPRLLAGGLYVSLTTGAYGLLTGVLDLIHRWLYTNGTTPSTTAGHGLPSICPERRQTERILIGLLR